MKTVFRKLMFVLSMMCIIGFANPVGLHATNYDGLNNNNSSNDNSSNSSNDSAISDYLNDYNPVTKDNMNSASTYASPIVNFLGIASGFIIMVASAGIFVVTALDLAYIGLPVLRPYLAPGGGAQGGSPMGGGMMGGMGMRGGMMGGMGGGMQGGGAQAGGHQWVSDEAIACVRMAGGAQGGAAPMGGGMGMGMGGGMMGGGMMGGMQGGQPPKTRSIITEYLKKRTIFIIIFAICSVLLMSSVLTKCGLNLAELFIKIFNKLNGNIGNIQV